MEETGYLVDTRLPQAVHELEASRRCPKEPAGLEVALEGKIEQRLHVPRRELVEFIAGHTRFTCAAARAPSSREALDQADRASEILRHRFAHRFANDLLVVADERVQ